MSTTNSSSEFDFYLSLCIHGLTGSPFEWDIGSSRLTMAPTELNLIVTRLLGYILSCLFEQKWFCGVPSGVDDVLSSL